MTRFFDHHADVFTDESKEEIIYALTLVRLPDSAHFSTPPHVHGADDAPRDQAAGSAEEPACTPDAVLTPHDEAGFLRIPTADEATAFLDTVALASLVHPGRRCQRQLPKSCTDLVGKTLLDLSTLAQDLRLAASQRELAWIVFFLAPALLWPEPGKQEGGRPPQARPQLVKQCVQQVRSGHWIDLINGLPQPPARNPVEPTAPGVVTPSSAKAWMSEASRGRAAQAWRRLHSWGIAPSTPDTLAQVAAKWAIQPQHSLPAWQIPRLELLDMMIAPPRLAKALRHFQKSKASDAHGWAPAAFKQLLGQSQARKAILAALKAMWLNELSGLSLALSSISRSFPLRKNEQGQVRPIAMPTMFRKLQATLTSLHFLTEIQEYTGDFQYGTQRNGCARFGRWVNTYKLRFPKHICVQMDLQDAFCSADRRVLLRTMADLSSDLAAACSSWLATPSFTVIEGELEHPAIYQTTRGIAQGDPLSTVGFCMLMASARKEWMRTAANTSQWGAYVDDTVLIVDPAHLDESWTSASAVLAAHGLQINARKTRIWAQPEQIDESWHGCLQPSGLKLCGLPVWEDSSTGVHMDATPVGGNQFLADFMEAHCQDFAKRLSTLQALVQHLGPNSGALHASLRVLRTSMLQRHQHVLRTVPWNVLRPWMERLDHMVLEHVSMALDIPTWTPQALAAMRAPLDRYGLGVLSLAHEAVLCYISGSLALQALDGNQASDDTWSMPFQLAAARYEELTSTSVARALDMSEQELLLGHTHAMSKLRQRLHIRLGADLSDMMPIYRSEAISPAFNTEVRPADVVWSTNAWWASLAGPLLTAGPLQLALRRRLGYPVCPPGARCRYQFRHTGHLCGARLDPAGLHIGACAFSQRIQRHNALRNLWRTLHREAGHDVRLEQDVECGPHRAPEAPAVKRADFTAFSPGGLQIAADVVVCSTRDNKGLITPVLQGVETAKEQAYGVQAFRMELPHGRMFVPLAMHSETAQLGPAALAQLHRLTAIMREGAVLSDATSWQAQRHLVFSQCLARLGACLLNSEFCLFVGCGAR